MPTSNARGCNTNTLPDLQFADATGYPVFANDPLVLAREGR